MGYEIGSGQITEPLMFLLVSSVDHISPVTGVTPTVTISKNGGAFETPAGAVSEVGNGWYKVAAHASDSNTLGPLVLHATATGADPTDDQFDVVLNVSTGAGAAPAAIGSITARALISSAFRLLGVQASGESLNPDMGADALLTLSQMLDAWSAERLTIYAQGRNAHALTDAQQRYTIGGALGDFTEARPLWIDGAALIMDGRERPITVFTRDEWRAISDKSQAGTPIGIFYNPVYPLGEFDVWPVPDAACTLVLYTPAASLTSVASLATNISAPEGWAKALRYNLAVELYPEYPTAGGLEPTVARGAIESKAAIKRVNVMTAAEELSVDPALLGRSGPGWESSNGDAW